MPQLPPCDTLRDATLHTLRSHPCLLFTPHLSAPHTQGRIPCNTFLGNTDLQATLRVTSLPLHVFLSPLSTCNTHSNVSTSTLSGARYTHDYTHTHGHITLTPFSHIPCFTSRLPGKTSVMKPRLRIFPTHLRSWYWWYSVQQPRPKPFILCTLEHILHYWSSMQHNTLCQSLQYTCTPSHTWAALYTTPVSSQHTPGYIYTCQSKISYPVPDVLLANVRSCLYHTEGFCCLLGEWDLFPALPKGFTLPIPSLILCNPSLNTCFLEDL